MKRHQKGFTLTEIAIVLVLIALLIGAIIKGQEVVVSSKVTNVINDFRGVAAATSFYIDRYKAFPGDDIKTSRWPTAVTGGNGDGILQGTYNQVPSNPSLSTEETNNFWWHLKMAGLLIGATDTLNGPRQIVTAIGGRIGIQEAAGELGGMKGLILCTGLSDKIASLVDLKLDDGKPDVGTVRAAPGNFNDALPNTAAATYSNEGIGHILCVQFNSVGL